MKNVIRYGVFETNSSNTHAITIFTKEDYERYKSDKSLFASMWGNDGVFTEEELREKALKSWEEYKKWGGHYNDNFEEYFEDWICDEGYCTYSDFFYGLETDKTEYTSPSGDELVMICRYGYM